MLILAGVSSTINWFIERCGLKLISLTAGGQKVGISKAIRRRSGFVVLIVVVVCLFSSAAFGQPWDGNGIEGDPYEIWDACDMQAIGADSNYWDAHFELMADIDLSAYTGTSFNIIGYYTFSGIEPFSGVFDGNEHSVRNFTYHDINGEGVGIFGYLGENSEVRDVYVEDANVVGYYWVGLLVALNEGTISNCRTTGTVLGEENVGGLVGMNEFDSVIENCSADVVIDVNGDDDADMVGGLVGYNFYGTVTNSFANGIIVGGTDTIYTGGLAGFHRGGEITGCYANVDVSGFRYIGGLIGQNEGAVNSCYSTGDVNCVLGGGGLIGRKEVGVVDCYATGNVNVEEYAGGLIGWDIAGGVTNCYSTGAVNGTTGVGGLVGNTYDENVIYESCFWNSDNNPDMNGIGNRSDPNVIGETTANMQTESTYTDAGWDFEGEVINGPNDIWKICDGESYPQLWFEKYGGGLGDANNPYLIYTSCQMQEIGADSNDWDKHFKLMADIDLSA